MANLHNPAITAPTGQIRELGLPAEEVAKISLDGTHPGIRERQWGLEARLDPSVTFEEFTYWAKIEREMEEEEHQQLLASSSSSANKSIVTRLKELVTRSAYNDEKTPGNALPPATGDEKEAMSVTISPPPAGSAATHDFKAEWRQAARALRTASWGSVFYLITTDILGWAQTPYVFSNTGYGLGAGMFVLMGLAAFAGGWMIYRTFLALDSSRYPVWSFGDPFFRLFGPRARHLINIAQALDMFLTVAVCLLLQTGVLAQLGGSVNLCFVVCGIIALVVGMASGYLRALKSLGWFCNACVWMNIISFIIICVAAAKFGPDPTAAVQNGILPKEWALPGQMEPVRAFSGTPPPMYQPTNTDLFAANFNGINTIVYAFSGGLLFVAFLAEMRHPMDFWKAMLFAQIFIAVVYVFFGAFVYSFFGQYSYTAINQVVKPYGLQVLGNVLALLTLWIAIFLYFNVGMKTIYLEVGVSAFGLPPITTKKGKYLWWSLGPVYWILAFVLAMSVPQFTAFTNLVGALSSLNLTFSFPGMMYLAYVIQDGARLSGEGFDPSTGATIRFDSGWKRWTRGLRKTWKISLPVFVYTLCGLASCGMGTWAAILALQGAFSEGGSVTTSWTCTNPYYIPADSSSS